jgi:hypothetical protein
MGLHRLACELGMTVREMCDRMSAKEFYDWVEYFTRMQSTSSGSGAPPLELATATVDQLKGMF